jgi:hypothetical protein
LRTGHGHRRGGFAKSQRARAPRSQDAEKLGLLAKGDVGDLIKKQRAAVGQLKAADAIGARISERSLDVAEDLALEGAFRKAAGIDGNERPGGAGRGSVEKLGDDLLAGAVLAGDEHVGIGGADLGDQLEDGLHRRRAGNELRHAFRAEQAIFKFKLACAAQGMVELSVHPDERYKALVLPGLLHKVASAALDGLDGQIDIAPGSHDNDGDARIDLLYASKEVEAFLPACGVAGVIEVDKNDIVVVLAEGIEEQLWRTDAVYVDSLRGKE